MKLTTDQIIERHGLNISVVTGGVQIWRTYFDAWVFPDATVAEAVEKFCARHGLSTAEPKPTEPTVEQLIERHTIRLEYNDVTGLWRARIDDTIADGFTAAGAVKEVVARIENDKEKQRASVLAEIKATVKRGLGVFGFEEGGYATGNGPYSMPLPTAPAKKPAQVIADAKQAAQKRITEYIKSEADALKNTTGAMLTRVDVQVEALRVSGSHEVAAFKVLGVTLVTG